MKSHAPCASFTQPDSGSLSDRQPWNAGGREASCGHSDRYPACQRPCPRPTSGRLRAWRKRQTGEIQVLPGIEDSRGTPWSVRDSARRGFFKEGPIGTLLGSQFNLQYTRQPTKVRFGQGGGWRQRPARFTGPTDPDVAQTAGCVPRARGPRVLSPRPSRFDSTHSQGEASPASIAPPTEPCPDRRRGEGIGQRTFLGRPR